MSERVWLNPKWFEPGPNGVSPFERKYLDAYGGVPTSISAAFRALLAERDDMTTRAHDECQRANNWKNECQFHKDRAYTAIAERDALQSRIDGGVRVYVREHYPSGGLIIQTGPEHGARPTILIDAQPIDHIADAGKMADERKGEEVVSKCGNFVRNIHTGEWCPNFRITHGTREDRRQA